jgi:Zn-dependent alcohol dehydrogenase
MRTRGAVVREVPGKWEILEVNVEEPRQGELQLAMVAAGLCHSYG